MSTPAPSGPSPASTPTGEWVGAPKDVVESWVDRALARDSFVRFMVEKMEEAGCRTPRAFFQVDECSAAVGGGFRPGHGILICHNHLASYEEVSTAMTHELIHAFDHCRARDLDWTRCRHHACSEIRAAGLSGDCDWKNELARGNLSLRAQYQACIKRRAELSVAMNPHCGGKLGAKMAVEKAFDECYPDTAPFDRRP